MKKILIITLLTLSQQLPAMNGKANKAIPLLEIWAPLNVNRPRTVETPTPLLEQWMPEQAYLYMLSQTQQKPLTIVQIQNLTFRGQ